MCKNIQEENRVRRTVLYVRISKVTQVEGPLLSISKWFQTQSVYVILRELYFEILFVFIII